MYIDVRNALQEGISLYRITLLQPITVMDFLIGVSLLCIYPIVFLLCLASNCSPSPKELCFHLPQRKNSTDGPS